MFCYFGIIGRSYIRAKQKLSLWGKKKQFQKHKHMEMTIFTLPFPVKATYTTGSGPKFTDQWNIMVKEIGSGSNHSYFTTYCLF